MTASPQTSTPQTDVPQTDTPQTGTCPYAAAPAEDGIGAPAQGLERLDFDPLLAASVRHPTPMRMRLPYGEGPAWLAGKYADVVKVTADERFRRGTRVDVARMAPSLIAEDTWLTRTDPPDHTRLRSAVAAVFGAKAMEKRRAGAERTAKDLLAKMLERERPADLVAEVLKPLSDGLVHDVVGIPASHRTRVIGWTRRFLSGAHDHDCTMTAKNAVIDNIAALVELRRNDLGDDVISHLIRAEDDGLVTRGELLGVAVQFHQFSAMRFSAAQVAYLLLTEEGLLGRLRAEPHMVPAAVEELLRVMPIIGAAGGGPRVTSCAVEVGGSVIPPRSTVYSSYVAANRDPAVYEDPDRVDIDRRAKRHLTFGYGPHHCPAAPLGRLALQALVGALAEQPHALSVVSEQVRWASGGAFRGPVKLPVTWRSG
ncbi:cytochrome P450 [Streptomyces sp. NA04227]|uniref:cytochrome P450 n=1 Tax=Streptomyces sp. NA04227 TaxID=2742136 RepID=UPI00158FCD1F|nr:cytochrome P450 [Streptomyces sp. NA04227]QKW08267.1 cytochrome P450 [Streptomyces sp. NA04227]